MMFYIVFFKDIPCLYNLINTKFANYVTTPSIIIYYAKQNWINCMSTVPVALWTFQVTITSLEISFDPSF